MTRYHRQYRYERFKFAEEPAEEDFFRSHAPPIGSVAPDFDLKSVDGEQISLHSLPSKPVVIEFGSYTCPLFSGRVKPMENLAVQFNGATFIIIYGREAHPGETTPQPRTLEQKRKNALRAREHDAISRIILVDDLDGRTHLCYGGGYNSVFVLDPSRRVVLRRYWNEPNDVRRVLRDLSAGVRPVPFGSMGFGSPTPATPSGPFILDRGGRNALRDFAADAPPSVQMALEASTEEVQEALATGRRTEDL